MKYTQHPLSAAFPAMSDEDFQALKDDIEVNGQREPVMLFEGMVLDGWHRYRAVTELGMTLKSFTKPDDEDPVVVAKSANMHRRHLTASQRAIAEVALHQWAPAGKQKAGAKAAAAAALPATTDTMAKDAKVSPRMIRDAKVVHKAGLSEPVRDGALTLEKAAAVARGKPTKPKKTTLPPAPAPERGQTLPPAEDFGPTDAELAAQAREQEEEAAALRRLLEADDKLAALASENQQLRAEIRVLKERRDGLMNENAELVKRIKALQRKLDKLEQTA